VGISGGTAIVGALQDDDAGHLSGSAYLFTTPEPSTFTLAVVLVLLSLLAHGRRRRA